MSDDMSSNAIFDMLSESRGKPAKGYNPPVVKNRLGDAKLLPKEPIDLDSINISKLIPTTDDTQIGQFI